MDERVRDRAGPRSATCATAVRVPATIEPLTGGEAIVAAPAAGRFTAETLLVGRRSRARRARRSAASSRGSRPAATIARRSTPTVAEAQAALEAARAEQARAERLLAERAVPARRVEDAQRAVTRRRGAAAGRRGAAGAARRDAANRRRRRVGQRVRRCARRSPAASPRCSPTLGARTTKARRCSGSSGPIASSCRRRCRPADVAAAARTSTALALEVPGRAGSDRRSSPITCTTPASSTRRRARCRCSSRSRIRAASC